MLWIFILYWSNTSETHYFISPLTFPETSLGQFRTKLNLKMLILIVYLVVSYRTETDPRCSSPVDSGSSDADKQAKQNHEKGGECLPASCVLSEWTQRFPQNSLTITRHIRRSVHAFLLFCVCQLMLEPPLVLSQREKGRRLLSWPLTAAPQGDQTAKRMTKMLGLPLPQPSPRKQPPLLATRQLTSKGLYHVAEKLSVRCWVAKTSSVDQSTLCVCVCLYLKHNYHIEVIIDWIGMWNYWIRWVLQF